MSRRSSSLIRARPAHEAVAYGTALNIPVLDLKNNRGGLGGSAARASLTRGSGGRSDGHASQSIPSHTNWRRFWSMVRVTTLAPVARETRNKIVPASTVLVPRAGCNDWYRFTHDPD